jgi:hypothetical protein
LILKWQVVLVIPVVQMTVLYICSPEERLRLVNRLAVL